LALSTELHQSKTVSTRPNVILIMLDQMRYDCAGFMGNDEVRTPVMDRLASEGVAFENAYCAAPQCSPARASWLTGLYPHTHGQLTNYGHRRRDRAGRFLPKDQTTLSDVLAAAGYRCGLAGPWHLGDDETPQHGYQASWEPYKYPDPDCFDSYKTYLRKHDLYDLYGQGQRGKRGSTSTAVAKGESFVDTCAMPTEHQRTTWAVDRAMHFADTQASPFFFFLSIKDPHPPILPPAECYREYDPADISLPANWEDTLEGRPAFLRDNPLYGAANYEPEVLREIVAHYYALITHIDNQLGRLMDHLANRGFAENTLVCLISDHGEMMGEHGCFAKGLMYEGSIRVPCLLHWPTHLAAGARICEPFGGVDLFPTLLDLAGATLPKHRHGRSFATAASNGTEPDFMNTVFAEIGNWRKNALDATEVDLAQTLMVRRGPWKYIIRRDGDLRELYNLDSDPDEMANRADDPRAARALSDLHARAVDRLTQDGPGPYRWVLEHLEF